MNRFLITLTSLSALFNLTVGLYSTPVKPTPPTHPKCPKKGDYCINQGDVIFNFGKKHTPECWVIEGDNDPTCYYKPESGACDKDEHTLDISNCPGSVEEPSKYTVNECPKVGTDCVYQGDIAYVFGVFKDVPECWERTGDTTYKCDRKVNGKCAKASDKDVSSCPDYKN